MFSHVALARTLLCSAAVALGLAAVPCTLEGAQQQQKPQQAVTIAAGLERSQVYQPDAWLPVRVQLSNPTNQPIDGSVVLPLSHPRAPSMMTLPVTVPAHGTVNTTLWGYFPPQRTLTAREQQQQDRRGVGASGAPLPPPLSTVEWRGTDGALLSRAQVAGIPFTPAPGQEGQSAAVVLLVDQRSGTAGDDAYDTELLLTHLTEAGGPPLQLVTAGLDGLPRDPAGLRAVRAVVLDGVDPDALDRAQRDALLSYLRGGGVLVLAAPGASAGKRGTWLAPLLPVSLLGTREARQLDVLPGGAPLKLRRPVPIVEAVAAGSAEVLLGDRDFVHVAVQPVGLGKVVFTSFPVNALDTAQPQAAVLWEQLLSVRRPQWEWERTLLGEVRHEVVGGMIGRPVAPWVVAAGVSGGYLLVILAAQVLFLGPARPRAFGVTVAAAVLVSGTLIVMGMARRTDQRLQSARLAIVDVAPDGGGWRTETVAFVGADDPRMRLEAADERVTLRPALADANNRPVVRQQPFAVEQAAVFADRIERVWEAAGPADPALRISAFSQLGTDGLTLDVENSLGTKIESPLVIWNGRALAMADLPPGRMTVRDLQVNARGQFAGLGVLTSAEAKRRAQVVAASLAPANELSAANAAPAEPMLIGWIADGAAPPLVRPVDREDIEAKSMVMVRTPLRFHVSPPGSAVVVPAALVAVDTGRMPYDHAKGESVPTPQGDVWQIRFAPPAQAGRVKPKRITVAARVTLPSHTLRLRMASRADADAAVEWSRRAGAVEKTFECTSADYDEHGRIRMTLEVESHDPASPVPWQISDLRATMEGTVSGPPEMIVLDAPTTRSPDASHGDSPAEDDGGGGEEQR